MKYIVLTALGAVLSTPCSLAQSQVDFQKDILPIFRDTCLRCHGPERVKGKLRLDTKEAAMKGGSSGDTIKPGDATGSELYKRIILPKDDVDVMPNEGETLTKAQIDLIKAWIDQGAKWPDGVVIAGTNAPAASAPPQAAVERLGQPAPEPTLPEDFKPGAEEASAIEALAAAGVDVRPLAQDSPWREANFRLQGEKITDETIVPLKDIRSLVELNLANTKVSDAGLVALKDLPYLKTLHLELTGVTDSGLEQLKGLSNLVYLNLYGTEVTDAGLEHLDGLKHLQRLYLWQSKVTPEGAKKLEEARPGLYVNLGWNLATPADAPAIAENTEKN
jgi:hypothetical protein